MRRLLVVLLATAIAGCAQYKLGDKSYSSKEEALAALKQRHDEEILSKIEPLPKPVGRTAKFVGIKHAVLLERATIGANMDGRGYVAETQVANMKATYEAIVKRNIFQKVEYAESDGLDQNVAGEDAVIYFGSVRNSCGY